MVGEQRTASIKAKGQIHVKYFRSIVAAMALLSLPAMSASADSSDRTDDPVTMGYVENVYVGKLGLEMKGKLDTGADSSSVFARDVHIYNKSGKDDWVRFRLVGKNGRTVRYDQNVRRFALIKLKKGGTIRRPVIHLPLCIGGVSGLAEVNLAFHFGKRCPKVLVGHGEIRTLDRLWPENKRRAYRIHGRLR